MKRIILFLSISLIAFSTLSAQVSKSELLNQRNQYFQLYKGFKDTMTIRTWSNMVELSNRLEKVVLLDNVLIDSLQNTTAENVISKPDLNLESKVQELSSVKDQLITDNARLNAEFDALSKQKSNHIFIIVVIIIVLILVIISWVRVLMKYKRFEKYSDRTNDKLLTLKQIHKQEMDLLKDEITKLKDDQLLMESTADQMKKSYEILKSEQSQNIPSDTISDEEGLNEVRKEMEAISEEVSSILDEKQKIEEDLKIATQELLKYQNANKTMEDELIKNQQATKSIEDELELLLRKLKNE